MSARSAWDDRSDRSTWVVRPIVGADVPVGVRSVRLVRTVVTMQVVVMLSVFIAAVGTAAGALLWLDSSSDLRRLRREFRRNQRAVRRSRHVGEAGVPAEATPGGAARSTRCPEAMARES